MTVKRQPEEEKKRRIMWFVRKGGGAAVTNFGFTGFVMQKRIYLVTSYRDSEHGEAVREGEKEVKVEVCYQGSKCRFSFSVFLMLRKINLVISYREDEHE